jgi:hypothetical protein
MRVLSRFFAISMMVLALGVLIPQAASAASQKQAQRQVVPFLPAPLDSTAKCQLEASRAMSQEKTARAPLLIQNDRDPGGGEGRGCCGWVYKCWAPFDCGWAYECWTC